MVEITIQSVEDFCSFIDKVIWFMLFYHFLDILPDLSF